MQGVEHRRGSLILWSLGNLVFGGTHEMTTFDAVVAQVSLCFDGGEYQAQSCGFAGADLERTAGQQLPARMAEGADYERIMGLIQDDSEMQIEAEMWFPAG